jgi:hypothetical protein
MGHLEDALDVLRVFAGPLGTVGGGKASKPEKQALIWFLGFAVLAKCPLADTS